MSNFPGDNPLKEILEEQPMPPPPVIKKRNPFRFAIIILVILIVLTLMVLVGLYTVNRGAQRAAYDKTAAFIYAANTATVQAATQQAYLYQLGLTPSPTATRPPATNTPVVALPSATPTSEVSAADLAKTATLAAMLTEVAKGPLATPTALPKTGIGDMLGLPLLAVLAALCVIVIFIVRRTRHEMQS
jgi:hypothetical protein